MAPGSSSSATSASSSASSRKPRYLASLYLPQSHGPPNLGLAQELLAILDPMSPIGQRRPRGASGLDDLLPELLGPGRRQGDLAAGTVAADDLLQRRRELTHG